jgi:hypothetical protein
MTRGYYNTIQDAPEGSIILYKNDPSPGFWAEHQPQYHALLFHMARQKLRCVIYTSNDYSTGFNEIGINEVIDELDALGWEYGTDYINLGYIPGVIVSTVKLSEDPWSATATDARGNDITTLPLMQDFKRGGEDVYAISCRSLDNIAAAITYLKIPFGVKVINPSSAADYSEVIAFWQTGQIDGMLGAIHGYAEYEQLIGRPGLASAQLDAQSIGHILILIGLIAGNITYFVTKARGVEEERIGWRREV